MKKIKINDELEVLFEMMPTDGVKFTNNTEKCVYAYMWFWSVDDRNVDGVFKMPMTALTNTLGICRKTASIMVASLVRKGCFEVVNKGSNLSKTASTYRFTLGLKKSIYTLNININRNRNFNSNRNGKDNGNINRNGKDRIGVVNNVSVTQTENDIELKYISTANTANAPETSYHLPLSSKLECSVQPLAVDSTRPQQENEIEQPKEGVDTNRGGDDNVVETTSPFLSQPLDDVSKKISWEELDRNPHISNTQPAIETTSTPKDVEMVTNSCATVDDINDAIGSIALKTTHQSSKQENITNLWNELRNGDNPEQAYSQLEELFKCGSLSDRQWETTNKIRSERLDAVKTTSNQKKKKEKKVGETPNKTLLHFPDKQMEIFNYVILKAYNACKTALDQEKNEGKAFDEEKYLKAFEQYAFGLDKLCDETDDDGNRFGDYNYLKSKVWMVPFSPKSNDDTKAICERYQSIQAKRQAVVNA
jgi:hypothetical protein